MDIGLVFTILLSNILIYNFIFSRFLGLCPYMGCTKEMSTAIGMGLAVIFVMTLAAFVTWPVYNYMLAPTASNIWAKIFGGDPANYDLTRVLRTITFILVIAGLVQFVEMFLMKVSPPLYRALGIYLPLITTNCAVLGVSVLNIDMFFADGKPVELSFAKSVLQGFGGGHWIHARHDSYGKHKRTFGTCRHPKTAERNADCISRGNYNCACFSRFHRYDYKGEKEFMTIIFAAVSPLVISALIGLGAMALFFRRSPRSGFKSICSH